MKYVIRTRPLTRGEVDPDWANLQNSGLGAFYIGELEDSGFTRESWAALAEQDRIGIIAGLRVSTGLRDAFEVLAFPDAPRTLKAAAQRYMSDLAAKDQAHAEMPTGFHADSRREWRFTQALLERPRVEALLAVVKAAGRHDEDAYTGAWLRRQARRLADEAAGREIAPSHLPSLDELRELQHRSARSVANRVVARVFEVSAEDLRLGRRRTR